MLSMACQLSNVVGIMDMNGFMDNKKFFCKELGLFKNGDAAAWSFFFDLGLRWNDLSPKDKGTYKCVESFVHKLAFGVPRGTEAIGFSSLEGIVSDFYHKMKQDGSSVITYEGGHYERDLLASLCIPSLNLECFGCPKAGEYIDHLIWVETYGNYTRSDAHLQCSKVEVEAFGQWLENTLVKHNQ